MKTVVPRENPLRAKKRTNINPRWVLLGVFGGVCRLVLRILTLFQTRRLKSIPILRPGLYEIMSSFLCLVPRPHYYARPIVSGHVVRESFRGVSRPFVSDTSPRCIDREGLERRRKETRQIISYIRIYIFLFLSY